MYAEAAHQTHTNCGILDHHDPFTNCGMLDQHAPFPMMPVASTVALDPVNAPAVKPNSLNALAEVPKVAGIQIAHQVSADGKAEGSLADGETNGGLA